MTMELRLAERLKGLRQENGWSLDELASHSGVSRATLSRIEKAEVSPTAAVLGRLCSCYGLTLSQLMVMAEGQGQALIRAADQAVWEDKASGFVRRLLSPPEPGLKAEVIGCTLAAGAALHYPQPPRPGLEHHLLMQAGRLRLSVGEDSFELGPGDCLRYRTYGATDFQVLGNEEASYLLVLV
ncbi:XRE family transcriptional regulator [Gallaecimonas kandeliae]|uniref:helix-turn-helix domain-containing protein n=1 Tax=Gallaecimonas kandeliae TaxID=3029055 RepID=UPI002648E19C|nr:XRE family transcriptional regulator [Gallaecimonas kandeliae]WKE64641.1 XRE family transcriptional regulator [Gallaecimonas kandeliae]